MSCVDAAAGWPKEAQSWFDDSDITLSETAGRLRLIL